MSNDSKPYLYHPLPLARTTLRNRIVMAPLVGNYATRDGFLPEKLYRYYVRRAHGGVGLIITEPMQVLPPDVHSLCTHFGLYADAFVPRLRHLAEAVQGAGARLIVTLDAPPAMVPNSKPALRSLAESFIQAAWRAMQAGCDGVLLSATDGGILQALLAPTPNQPYETDAGLLTERLFLTGEIIKGIRAWLGPQFIVGFRLVAEEFSAEGLRLHHTQFIARYLSAIGVNLLDVTADEHSETPVARFPGWYIPLVQRIKRVVPGIPVIGSGLMGDPYLAEGAVREGSVDLVMLDRMQHIHPYWPQLAQIILVASRDTIYPEVEALEADYHSA